MAYIPLGAGILTLYLWVHVKIFFDQMSKAGRGVPAVGPAPAPAPSQPPMTIAVMAPPYHGHGHGHGYGSPPYGSPIRQQKMSGPTPIGVPPTPYVQPPTPLPPGKMID